MYHLSTNTNQLKSYTSDFLNGFVTIWNVLQQLIFSDQIDKTSPNTNGKFIGSKLEFIRSNLFYFIFV